MALPRTIPATAHRDLADHLAAAGVRLDGLKPRHRVTLLADHNGTHWELTWIGCGDTWKVVGPGYEWGPAAAVDEVADYITTPPAPAAEPEPDPATVPLDIPAPTATGPAPRDYAGTPVPALVRDNWTSPLADGWRLGIRSALAARP